MIRFLQVLLFGNLILLTPHPVDIYAHDWIALAEPISAITPGAILSVDVTAMLENPKPYNLAWADHFEELFPPGSLSATLVTRGGKKVRLEYRGGWAYDAEGHITLILECGCVPTDAEVTKIRVETDVPLRDVLLYWKNYTM